MSPGLISDIENGSIVDRLRRKSVKANIGVFAKDSLGVLEPSDPTTPIDDLKEKIHKDGYLFCKGLLNREDVLKVREAYFNHFSSTGMLDPTHTAREGIFATASDPKSFQSLGAPLPSGESWTDLIRSAHSLPEFMSLMHSEKLHSFVRDLTGWENQMLLPRIMVRFNVPGATTTGTHYDQIFLRGGSDSCWITAWIPLGYCAFDGGGLAYLSDSMSIGREQEEKFKEEARDMTDEERRSAFNQNMMEFGVITHDAPGYGMNHGRKWLVADYEAGDVVFHDPYMVHCAVKNEDEQGRIRLSADVRFVNKDGDYDRRWMQAWDPDDKL